MRIEHKDERWVRWECPKCNHKQNEMFNCDGGPSYEYICGCCDTVIPVIDLPIDTQKDHDWACEIIP